MPEFAPVSAIHVASKALSNNAFCLSATDRDALSDVDFLAYMRAGSEALGTATDALLTAGELRRLDNSNRAAYWRRFNFGAPRPSRPVVAHFDFMPDTDRRDYRLIDSRHEFEFGE